ATCNDGFQNGDEIGIDCGGPCRPCVACTTKVFKNLGKGYIIEGSGITHLSTRSIRCANGYEHANGNLESQIITCLDGQFQAVSLTCQEVMISVKLATMTMFNASDLDYTAISSIHTALVNSLSIIFPDVLKITTVSKQQQQSSSANVNCVDQSATTDLPYSCSAMANFCETKLSVLAATQGVSLPESISVDTLVKEICLVTCNECDPTETTTSVVQSSGDSPLYVDFAIKWNHPTLSIGTRFTEDLPFIFINQIAVQFITRNIQLSTPSDSFIWNTSSFSTTSAATALSSRPITVAFSSPIDGDITTTTWENAFAVGSTDAVAKRIEKSAGLPFPTVQNISFLPSSPSNLVGFSSSSIASPKSADASYLSFFYPVRVDYPSSELPIRHLDSLSYPILSSVQGACVGTTSTTPSSANPNSCCPLHIALHSFLEGPCGTLLYDESLSSNSLTFFCETDIKINNSPSFAMFSSISSTTPATCLSIIRKELRNYEHRGGPACELNIFVKELVNSWCARSSQGKYCFLSVQDVLSKVTLSYLTSLSSSELDKGCATDSCLRQNTKYFDALTQLQLAWAILFNFASNSDISRRLSVENIEEEQNIPFSFSSSSALSKGHQGLFRHMALHQKHDAALSKEIQSMVQSTLKYVKGSPPLDERSFFSSKKSSLSSQRRLSTSVRLNQSLAESGEEILNLACMRAEGDYCQQTLQLLFEESPIVDPFLIVQPCISRCFVPVTGAMGVIIEKQGIHQNNPYDEVLGAFMRGYGRFYCITNNAGQYCGDLLYNRIKKSQVTPYTPQGVDVVVPTCGCPLSFLQDGFCDPSCFVANCGWDGEDCLARQMFPEIYSTLQTYISNQCSFFNKNFVCTSECKNAYIDAQAENSQGCCLSAALEQWGYILQIESKNPNMQHSQSYNTNRSIAYVEQLCEASFDRTCSHGASRKLIRLGVVFKNINSDAFQLNTNIIRQLEEVVVKTVSRKLQIIEWDVIRVVTRMLTQRISVDLDIDSHPFETKLLNVLSNRKFTADLEKAIFLNSGGIALKLYAFSLAKPISVSIPSEGIISENIASLPFSITNQATLPYSGTRGIEDLNIILPFKQCSQDDLWRLGPGYVFVSQPDTTPGFHHGSIRIIRCANSYESIEGPNPGSLRCDNGKWIVEGLLDCRKNCLTSPEEVYRLSEAYTLTGGGSSHGSYRSILCNDGYTAIQGENPTLTYCKDGSWDALDLVCKPLCNPFPPLSEAYIATGFGVEYGNKYTVTCAQFYYPRGSPSTNAEATSTCVDGQWTPLPFECVKPQALVQSGNSSTFLTILNRIFTGGGVLGALVLAISLFIVALAIFIAWRCYFAKSAKNNMKEREKHVQAFRMAAQPTQSLPYGGKAPVAPNSNFDIPQEDDKAFSMNYEHDGATSELPLPVSDDFHQMHDLDAHSLEWEGLGYQPALDYYRNNTPPTLTISPSGNARSPYREREDTELRPHSDLSGITHSAISSNGERRTSELSHMLNSVDHHY
ncbi:hypothetical protein IE077_003115, partial [Cardiosporidium cionae]